MYTTKITDQFNSQILPYLSDIIQQHYKGITQTENPLFPSNVEVTKQIIDMLIRHYINEKYGSISQFVDDNFDELNGVFSFHVCKERIITFYDVRHSPELYKTLISYLSQQHQQWKTEAYYSK